MKASIPYAQLYDEYYDKVFVYIARRIGNTHDAEDLTAETFIKAFAHPYNPQLAEFSTYIYTIASNTLKNYYRANHKRTTMFVVGDLDESLPGDADTLCDLISGEECDALTEALTMLTERQYEVVYRRYYLEQSFKGIGTEMNISETNARQLHFEAIKKLKKVLKTA